MDFGDQKFYFWLEIGRRFGIHEPGPISDPAVSRSRTKAINLKISAENQMLTQLGCIHHFGVGGTSKENSVHNILILDILFMFLLETKRLVFKLMPFFIF